MTTQAPLHPFRLGLYQPDMAGNAGAAMRLAACLGVGLDIIEPCGFIWDDRKMDRAAMDYKELCALQRHIDWDAFQRQKKGRVVLLTTKGATDLYEFAFQPGDILLAGRESAGVPDEIHNAVEARVRIPMASGARSLNVATSLALVAGEATRQLIY